MRPGQLRHRIEIQALTVTPGSMGEPTETWATSATIWGAVYPLKGKEWFESKGKAIRAEVTHRVHIRYMPGITPKHRVKFGSRIFRIESVLNPEERNRELILMCCEEV